MDFELADELNELLKADQLDNAIEVAEENLNQFSKTDFHQVLDRDLLHLTGDLANYINDFHKSAQIFFERDKNRFLSSIFRKKQHNEKTLKSIYSEMNGFTINYDRWYIDLFAYSIYEGLSDLDWLADFEYSSEQNFTITGFEDLQMVYHDYMENEKWKNEELESCCEICELLIILRLQELFREAFNYGKKENFKWTRLPVLVTAHDYELVYNATGN